MNSTAYSYLSCKSVLRIDTVWEGEGKRWNELAVGKLFTDDADATKTYYVNEYIHHLDIKKRVFIAVPYDGDVAKAKAIAVDENDDYIWDAQYVLERTDVYDAETRPSDSTSSLGHSDIRPNAVQGTKKSRHTTNSKSTTTPQAVSNVSTTTQAVSNVVGNATEEELQLLGKLFALEGKRGSTYLVVEVSTKWYAAVCVSKLGILTVRSS